MVTIEETIQLLNGITNPIMHTSSGIYPFMTWHLPYGYDILLHKHVYDNPSGAKDVFNFIISIKNTDEKTHRDKIADVQGLECLYKFISSKFDLASDTPQQIKWFQKTFPDVQIVKEEGGIRWVINTKYGDVKLWYDVMDGKWHKHFYIFDTQNEVANFVREKILE